MFEANPFAVLSEMIPAAVQQVYVVLMVILVIGGTVLDMMHKRSAEYFFANAKKAKENAVRQVSGGEKVSLAVSTLTNEVLTSGEFENPRRRVSHLFTMYGFIFFVASTAVMIFSEAPASFWNVLWHLGALMVCIGGYWFWFFIRVDVSAEGHPWYRLVRADLFIVSLLATATFALIWSATLSGKPVGWNLLWFALFILSSTTLFGTVLWSKFAHMFFKPAAAFQKRVTKADGSRENLPKPADRSDPADCDRHSMELLKDAPMDMGLGIKREPPRHY